MAPTSGLLAKADGGSGVRPIGVGPPLGEVREDEHVGPPLGVETARAAEGELLVLLERNLAFAGRH